jgi:hypothetical protein
VIPGLSFDWADRSWAAAAGAGAALPARQAGFGGAAPAAAAKEGSSQPVTLDHVDLSIEAGQLVAVVGEVGSGKSSLLAALLGELQPMAPPPGDPAGATPPRPVVRGPVAYCTQIPWVMAATIKARARSSRASLGPAARLDGAWRSRSSALQGPS